MNVARLLEEYFSLANSSKVTERKKGFEKIRDLLSSDNILEDLNSAKLHSWEYFLDNIQVCLKRECEKRATKTSTQYDKNFENASEVFNLIIKSALHQGVKCINISKLIRYMDGCLKEKNMKMCRNLFLLELKNNILPNITCLGHLDSEDFLLIFEILKSEFTAVESSDVLICNCFVMLMKHSPLCGLPPSYLREQFTFMSKFCQDAKPNDPRSVHNDVMETVLDFCKHTVEDNRMSCIKFGEDVFYALLQLYNASGHESAVKERFLDFCLLQMTIRNPDGVVEGDSQALASSWDLWKRCIRSMYSILSSEISNYLQCTIKNTLIFIPHGRSTLLLQSFVSLFVEVSKQLLNYKEHIPSSDPSEHPQKRIKLEMTFEFFVQEIQETKSWIWIKLTGALLDKYPEVIDENLFLQLLKLLHSLQCEEKDTNTTNYIYECQGILIDVQNRLNFDSKDEIDGIWRLIGESTLSAVGLNQSIEETQILLQKLIKNNYIDLESAVQIYKPGVLTVTKYHLSTTERILEQTNFAELTKTKRINFLHSLLSFENVKDPKCFLEPNFAKILVALILKQYPDGDINIPKERCDKFQELKTLYAKSSFSLNHLLLEENKEKSKDSTRIYNTENEIIDSVSRYIKTLVQNSNSKNTGCRLCIFGLLYNILNKLIEYKIITEDTMEENEIFVILKRIINKDNLIEEIMKYQKQDVKLLREVLEVASILDTIWSIRNHITDSVKNVFSLPFLQALFETVNFLQNVRKRKYDIEQDVKIALTRALSKYCIITSHYTLNEHQVNIMRILSSPDYDFKTDIDYNLSLSFLENVKFAKPSVLPDEIIENILNCLQEICSIRYRNYENALEILSILKGFFIHLDKVTNWEYKSKAVKLLKIFYDHRTHYGPNVSVAILCCIEVLCKIDPDFLYAKWNNKEIVKFIPTFLSDNYQKVRYKAIDILVNFIKETSGTIKLETFHKLEELFCVIYENNIKVFEVEGLLTDERKRDELQFRTVTALYIFVSITINCPDWIEESLLALFKLQRDKNLFEAVNTGYLEKIIAAFELHYKFDNFLANYLENTLSKWINLGYDINRFPIIFFNCTDKLEFYTKYFNICLPLLVMKDRSELVKAANHLQITEKEFLENNCTKVFANALTCNAAYIGDQFLKTNTEIKYLVSVVGDKLKELWMENVEDIFLNLLTGISDNKLFYETFDEKVIFIYHGITYAEFQKCLKFVEDLLCPGSSLIHLFCSSKSSKLQKILLQLQTEPYTAIAEKKKLKYFHQYSICIDLLITNIKSKDKIITYFLRDTIYYLINLARSSVDNLKLSKIVIKYLDVFLKRVVPESFMVFEEFFVFTINSVKSLALINHQTSQLCLNILEFLIVDNASKFTEMIKGLDTFPDKAEFQKINEIHHKIKYASKTVTLEDEITSFLDFSNDIASRQDNLVHLKRLLATEKAQLGEMYSKLTESSSEECYKNSVLHRLTCVLVKMSCFPNKNISIEAIKCLGELGPANLATSILQSKDKVLDIKAKPLKLLTGQILSLLIQYIVDPDIKVVKRATDALYAVLKNDEAKSIAASGEDYGYGPINRSYIFPFTLNTSKSSSVRINSTLRWQNDIEIWCPSDSTDSNVWITTLVVELLNTFSNGSYFNDLIPLCKVKVKFCESILPLLIYLLLHLKNKTLTVAISGQINNFFTNHWSSTVTCTTEKTSIAVSKKAVKCMVDVINFIRQQSSILQDFKFEDLKLNYLAISKAAAFCSAHFSALLYGELWCRKQISNYERTSLTQLNSVKSGNTLLDYVYENESETDGITLQDILQNAYKSIGDLDSLSGCGFMFLLNPEYKVEYYKKLDQWDKVMNYYSSQSSRYTGSSLTNLIDSFKMNQFYQLPVLYSELSSEPQYECLWRLGQWTTNEKNAFKCEKDTPRNYEKFKFNSLKALCDGDKYTFYKSKEELGLCVIENLKHTSLESSKNLYPILAQLQSLVEMDDFMEAIERQEFDSLFAKWNEQDNIIRHNDFQFVEPIVAQRITLVREYIKKYPQLESKYFEMVLNFADYAKDEHHLRVAENSIMHIKLQPHLDDNIKNELQFRESQFAWLTNDKMIAQQLLRKLSNSNLRPRLKSNVLKMRAQYMAEIYSDRNTVLTSFSESVNLLNSLKGNETPSDLKNLEDTFDKIATFADKEYQQIVNHMKSDLFQKKVSNLKLCKERSATGLDNKKMTIDEQKAASFQKRQTKIEENEINTTKAEKDILLRLAIENYFKNLQRCDTNNIKIFRVMSLLLDNRDNGKLNSHVTQYLSSLPTYKYVTMLPQLIPHISNEPDFFSDQINKIIERCAIDHPHHTLPLLMALVHANKDQETSRSKSKISSNDRICTANSIVNRLSKNKNMDVIISKMKKMSEALIELAYYSNDSHDEPNKAYTIPATLKIHRIKNYDDILVPTCTLPVSKSNKYDNIEGIAKFNNKYKNVGGINCPKRIECISTTGKTKLQLVKGQDDLRQDAVMQQVFNIMTDVLASNKQTKNMLIRTYKVVPLSMRSGVLEWVANSMPIGSYLVGSKEENYVGAHRYFRPDNWTPGQCRTKYKAAANSSNEEKLRIFNEICENFKPVFHKFFETHFPQPSVWYERRKAYIHSVATTSMCGYILGIGDRHVSNILIDKQSAELIHIDFGIAFEQGKCLPTPETIPFRLTRDIVDGMGVSGVEGLFRKSCEKTMEVLRANSQTILTILEVLLYDPLYFWTVTPAEAHKRQTEENMNKTNSDDSEDETKNISAETALLRLRGKLQGTEEGRPTTVEQQVGMLIQQAMAPANLSRLFHGWQPYL